MYRAPFIALLSFVVITFYRESNTSNSEDSVKKEQFAETGWKAQLNEQTNATEKISGRLVAGAELLFYTDDSEFVNHSCEVMGEVPPWLDGILLRNGPGKFEMGNRKVSHLFDGFAKLHSFNFGKNRSEVLFSSRFLETVYYTKSVESEDISSFMPFLDLQPAFNILQKLTSLYNGMDNALVNVLEFDGKTLAVADMWKMYSFDKYTLSTTSQAIVPPLPAELPVFYNFIASYATSMSHPVQEYSSDAWISIVNIENPLPIYSSLINIIRMYSVERTELIASIPVDRAHCMHSFALTHRYAVVFADPLFINIPEALKHATMFDSQEWLPEMGTTVYVVKLEDGHVTQLHLPPPARFHEHQVNAYEKGDSIFLQVVTHTTIDILESLELNKLREKMNDESGILDNNEESQFIQYEIDLKHGTVTRGADPYSDPVSSSIEMPTFNEAYRFKHHCYTYGAVINFNSSGNKTDWKLVKANNCGDKDIFWSMPNHFPTEPIFVPDPNGVSEDHGVLLSVVMDGEQSKSFLLVLDAKNMKEVARINTPARIPITLHGRFFPH